jgi:hypothetical protein
MALTLQESPFGCLDLTVDLYWVGVNPGLSLRKRLSAQRA